MSDSILSKTARGAGWAIGWRWVTRLLGFVNTLILARLLIPADFGLVAVATGFSQSILAFSALGIDEAVIRQRTTSRELYDTAFTINLLRGLATAAVVALCAWPVSRFFDDARLMPILLVLAGCSLVTAFENIGTIEFRRDFAFAREFKLLLAPRLAAIAVTIGAALMFRNPWALVAGIATGQVLSTAAGYAMHPYRPRLSLSSWRQLSSFSVWTWAITVAIMIRDRVDAFVIGRFLGLTQVGIYAVGGELATLPTHELAGPLSRACFPGFAAAARGGVDTSALYLRILASIFLIALPAAAGVSLVAGPVVLIVLGPDWLAAVSVLRILGLAGGMIVLGTVTSTLLSAHGILRPTFAIQVMSIAVRVAGLLLLVGSYGLTGAAIAHAATFVVENLSYIVVAFRHFRIRALDFPVRIWRCLLATAAMGAIVQSAGLGADMDAPIRSFVETVLVGGGVYVTVLLGAWLASGRPEGAETDLIELTRRAASGLGLGRWLTAPRFVRPR